MGEVRSYPQDWSGTSPVEMAPKPDSTVSRENPEDSMVYNSFAKFQPAHITISSQKHGALSGGVCETAYTSHAASMTSVKFSSVASESTPNSQDHYELHLGNGVVLYYTEADYCKPPALNGIMSVPEKMYEIWDDTSPSWTGWSPLICRSVPIAVMYWRAFFGNFKKSSGAWSSFRQNFNSIKVCVFFSHMRFFFHRK